MKSWQQIRDEMKSSKKTASEPLPDELSGTITDIVEMTAGEVYGDDIAKDPDRPVLNITVEVIQTGDRFKTAFTQPQGRSSWSNPAFKLRQFDEKYGDLPDIGMIVEVETTPSGNYNIIL